ncbi:hypothetical protein LXL04_010794 [Taraxacum kok-saghyz]
MNRYQLIEKKNKSMTNNVKSVKTISGNQSEAAFKAAWPIIKPSFLKPTRGETPVRSTQACFPPIHPKTKVMKLKQSKIAGITSATAGKTETNKGRGKNRNRRFSDHHHHHCFPLLPTNQRCFRRKTPASDELPRTPTNHRKTETPEKNRNEPEADSEEVVTLTDSEWNQRRKPQETENVKYACWHRVRVFLARTNKLMPKDIDVVNT